MNKPCAYLQFVGERRSFLHMHKNLQSTLWSLTYGKVLQRTESDQITVSNFAFLFNCTLVGRTSVSMTVPTRAWCFGCCQEHQGLPFGFLLLWYPVLCTVQSMSLLYLLFISWFICSRRWCMNNIGSFIPTKHLCLLIHIWTKGEVGAPQNRFKPSSKIFYYRSKAVILLCFLCLVFLKLSHLFVAALWSPEGKRADHLALVCDVYCIFVTFPCSILGQV